MANEKVTIKRCPCCGSEARFSTNGFGGVRVECKNIIKCGLMQAFFDDINEAVEAWNKRAKDGDGE